MEKNTAEKIMKWEFSSTQELVQSKEASLKPGDLRIGNKIRRGDRIFEVKAIGEFLSISDYSDRFSYSAFEPIVLSPDILQYCRIKDKRFYLVEAAQGYSYDFTSIQYLHQLQNLYFALTGEELEVEMGQELIEEKKNPSGRVSQEQIANEQNLK
ncbi:MAG: hypothetical protein ACJ75B_12880 [Flavisolibacter sp.]